MYLLIGTDEAGYGPNLGPLVISASVWQVEASPQDQQLYDSLAAVVCREPAKAHARRVAWADSKALYSPGQGLGTLERGVLAALDLVGGCPTDWRGVWQALDPLAADRLDALPWHLRVQPAAAVGERIGQARRADSRAARSGLLAAARA